MFMQKIVCRNAISIVSSTSRYTKFSRSFSALPAHTIVVMPALSPTMEVGTIGKWLVKPGDEISAGVAIAEIETDKASMAFEAQDEFFIAKLLVDAGAEVKVGQPIFVSVESVSSVAAFSNFKLSAAAPVAAPAKPAVPTPAPVAAPAVAAPVVPAAAPAAPVKAVAPTPAPAAKAPAAKAPAAAHAHASNSGFYGARWGEGVKKSALLGKLSAQQAKYVEQYGRSAQKPL
jgi:pyruvate dehydrogenase E2 component (dihydrolipoamide acetyltransferase)